MKKLVSIILMLVLLVSLATMLQASAAGAPYIQRQPQSVTIPAGAECSFRAGATNATGITWYFKNPATGETLTATNAPDRFPGLGVKGKNSETLTLTNTPAALDGWTVYCKMANASGYSLTESAKITVLSAAVPAKTPAPAVTPSPANVPNNQNQSSQSSQSGNAHQPSAKTITVTATGAYLQLLDKSGKGSGETSHTLTFNGEAAFQVTCDPASGQTIDYWVINGVRYDFNLRVKNIVVTKLTYNVDFEVVYTKSSSKTLLTDAQIQARRTGEQLLVQGINAKLCHIKGETNGAGGYFNLFDFTNDYINRATEKTEKGGQVTVKVTATIPSGKRISYWKFNEAHFDFNSNVEYFFVRKLNASMVYEPVFGDIPTTKAPPTPTVRGQVPPIITIITPTPAPGQRPVPYVPNNYYYNFTEIN